MGEYCRLGDCVFDWERNNLRGLVGQFLDCLQYLGAPENSSPKPTQALEQTVRLFKMELRRIPCEEHATVFPPATPFAASRRIRAICSEAQQRIELFDPYVSAEVFYRYLPAISPTVPLTVVTKAVSPNDPNKKNHRRWDEVKAVAPTVQVEYPQFRLLVVSALHDRCLRVDDVAYHLGGSVKDAGKNDHYTISTLDPSLVWHLDNQIGKAKPWDAP